MNRPSSPPVLQATLNALTENAIASNLEQSASAASSVLATPPAALLAGGPDPQHFDWAEVWYPIYAIEDLNRSAPIPFTLLGRDLVIWWEPTAQQWRVMEDKCPHRLARLSEGRISEAGYLECPYHGWSFSGSGQCEHIPQLPENAAALQSPRACVKSLPTATRQGFLFVYPGKPENAAKTAIPIVEAMEETPEKWVCINIVRDLPYDALTLLENVLDPSHVPYTHHRTVGNRANAAPVDLEMLDYGKHGFTGKWKEGPRRGTLGQQDTRFIAPNLMYHDLTSKQFGRTLTVVYAVPIRKGECRLIARFPFKFSSPWPGRFIRLTPSWYSHIGQNAILEDDQIFLHHQERSLEAAGGSDRLSKAFYLPTKADLFVSQLHQWLRDYQAEPFPGEALPAAARSKAELLDRYHSHTAHCASCRGALANLKRIRLGLAAISTMAWAAIPLLMAWGQTLPTLYSAASSLMALSCLGGWAALGQLERRFYVGRAVPPRNLPEKSKKKN
ncbi:Rieske 2Fe-2S domain-containing protein [Altericista sp. CCNU0014]|uniref:aromatic ring-hydroxylating dioxygenase subunit alpha n=1 Tax=Altericista sp. CCNU0014 TaxID=3082949 RepID=UPI00384FCEC0